MMAHTPLLPNHARMARPPGNARSNPLAVILTSTWRQNHPTHRGRHRRLSITHCPTPPTTSGRGGSRPNNPYANRGGRCPRYRHPGPPDRPPTQRRPRLRSRRRPPHTRPGRTRCRSPICWLVRAPTAAAVHVGTPAPRSRTTTQRSLLQRRPPTTATQTFSHRCTKPHRSVLSTPMSRPTSTRRTWTTPRTRPSTTRPPRVGFGQRIWTTTSTPAPFPSGWAIRTPRSEKRNRNAHGGPST
ncbi:Uncharacterised protein [Mycobacteroides abscessus subsp. abscessus]|nr:Uncharacterised protein [Mycobacteroides abscessus subsp. abscessus]